MNIRVRTAVFLSILILPNFSFPMPQSTMLNKTDSTASNIRVTALNSVIHSYLSDSWNVLTAPSRMQKRHVLPMAGIAATAAMLYYFDPDITKAFDRSSGNDFYDRLIDVGEGMEPMGQIERMNPYCLGGYLIGYFIHSPKMQTASLQILESLAIAAGYKSIVLEIIGRARPSENLGARHFKIQEGESFPSGHTSNAFQVATILSYHVDWLPFSIASYGVATTIGLQRIDANLHWATDVFMGAVYGTAVARLLLRLHEKRELTVLPYYRAENNSIGLSINRSW
jgi:hypothetical protein